MTIEPAGAKVTKIDVRPEHWDNVFAPSSCLVIITTVDMAGNVNAASFGTCTRVNHDPVYTAFTCGSTGDTHDNVIETGEYVINVVPFERDILNRVIICGLPFKKGTNELEKAGLTALPSKTVVPPRIVECRSHFECKVEWTKGWANRMMVCGLVTAVSIDDDCLNSEGFIVWDRVRPAHYCGAHYKDRFVPANEPLRIDWVYDGGDAEFRKGRDWRNAFRSKAQSNGQGVKHAGRCLSAGGCGVTRQHW